MTRAGYVHNMQPNVYCRLLSCGACFVCACCLPTRQHSRAYVVVHVGVNWSCCRSVDYFSKSAQPRIRFEVGTWNCERGMGGYSTSKMSRCVMLGESATGPGERVSTGEVDKS